MEKETITDNLEKLLMAIHRQVVMIRDEEQQIPKIEMDKTLSNIRALYEQFTVLNYLNAHPVPKKIELEKPKEEPKPEPKEEIQSPFVPILEEQKTVEETKPVEIPQIHTAPPQPIVETKPVVPQEPEMPKAVEPQVKTVAQPTWNDERAGMEPQRLADKLRMQKIEDLHKAVPLSDKFLYMNELFEGENSAYKEAMDMLNRLSSFTEAVHYMDSLAARYKWSEHEKAENKFRELVSRKFV